MSITVLCSIAEQKRLDSDVDCHPGTERETSKMLESPWYHPSTNNECPTSTSFTKAQCIDIRKERLAQISTIQSAVRALMGLQGIGLDCNQLIRATMRYGLLIGVTLVFIGCVSVRVESLTSTSYPSRLSDEPVQWLVTEPDLPHIELARIIATSQSADEDRLRNKILARARDIGADAVVLEKSDILQVRRGSSPLFESTLGPVADSYHSNQGGWWSPFHYDAWSFMQSEVDQTEWMQYLSGTAIRYQEDRETP